MRTRRYKPIDPLKDNKYSIQVYTKITHSCKHNSTKSTESDAKQLPENKAYYAQSELSEDRYRFDTMEDPHSALNIFVKCIESGFYPPEELLTYFSIKFKHYISTGESLDSIIGLSKRSKKAYENSKRNIEIVTEIDTLRHYFNIEMTEAIEAVTRRYELIGTPLEDTTIEDIYNRTGKKQLEKSLRFLHQDISWLDEMSEEWKQERK